MTSIEELAREVQEGFICHKCSSSGCDDAEYHEIELLTVALTRQRDEILKVVEKISHETDRAFCDKLEALRKSEREKVYSEHKCEDESYDCANCKDIGYNQALADVEEICKNNRCNTQCSDSYCEGVHTIEGKLEALRKKSGDEK